MNKYIFILSLGLLVACSSIPENPTIATLGFHNCEPGDLTEINENGVQVLAAPENIRIYPKKGKTTPNSLHLVGGENKTLELINTSGKTAKYLSFSAERWTSKSPFQFKVEAFDGVNWRTVYNGDNEVKTGNFPNEVFLTLPDAKNQRVRLTATTAETGGVLIDDVSFFSGADMQIDSVVVADKQLPVLKGKKHNEVLNLQIFANGFSKPQKLEELEFVITDAGLGNSIDKIEALYLKEVGSIEKSISFGTNNIENNTIVFKGSQELTHGANNVLLSIRLKDEADIGSFIQAECISVKVNGKNYTPKATEALAKKMGVALRQHNDDGVDTYRIPGLATTNKGTLIGVYDIRRNRGVDLQEDIDVGMNRSTDGGQTWEPMKAIMDMGEWGGLPNDQNGIGDPAVLVDRNTNTIWVAGVWAHGHPGKRNWWASKPGMEPKNTSQFVLVKSEDDGLTWSEPINITKQVKNKEWHLLLQGPGKGITLKDGTLVFPAQFKDKEEMPHSTIIWSKDHGKSWTIGIGAKLNTTEAQVIELDNGSLMLNMRDNRNRTDASESNGRAVYTTSDLGNTWTKHSTSRTNVLQESTCQASIIKDEFLVNGKMTSVVLFSNPNTRSGRHHMTIKASFDDGETWPTKHQLLIDSGWGRGYSCMTKIDDEHIGILYEGSQADMTFQKFNIEEIVNGK